MEEPRRLDKLKFRIIQKDGYTYETERSLDSFYAWKERAAKGTDSNTWTPIQEFSPEFPRG